MEKNFEKTMDSFRSIEMMSHFMQNKLQYASEEQCLLSRTNGCWWKTPKETFNDRFGFCYDLASFALNGLENLGFSQAQLLFVAWGRWGTESNSGHFVCVYYLDDSYYSIDNGFIKGPYTFEKLLLSASRKREIWSYKCFQSNEIPYHIRYCDMVSFVGNDTTVVT